MRFGVSAKQRSDKVILDLMNAHPDRVTVNGMPYDPAAKVKRKAALGIYDSKLELAYSTHLSLLVSLKQISGWNYHCWRFDLTTGCMVPAGETIPRKNVRYTPDFLVILTDGSWEFHEVKGHWRQHDRMAWRTAAGQHGEYAWKSVQRVKGQWIYETFGDRNARHKGEP